MKYSVDLGIDGRTFVQDTDVYLFSSDSVILANLVKSKNQDYIIDLGAGSGIISILIALKKDCNKILGVELNNKAIELFKENIRINNLEAKVSALELDIKQLVAEIGNEVADIVVANPPYYSDDSTKGKTASSKTENTGTLEDFIICASKIVRFGGDFYMSMKLDRLVDTLTSLRSHNLEPKEMYALAARKNVDPDTFIIKSRKGGKPGLKTSIIYIQKEDGSMSDEIKKLYSK